LVGGWWLGGVQIGGWLPDGHVVPPAGQLGRRSALVRSAHTFHHVVSLTRPTGKASPAPWLASSGSYAADALALSRIRQAFVGHKWSYGALRRGRQPPRMLQLPAWPRNMRAMAAAENPGRRLAGISAPTRGGCGRQAHTPCRVDAQTRGGCGCPAYKP
jgi:hypothetical protein